MDLKLVSDDAFRNQLENVNLFLSLIADRLGNSLAHSLVVETVPEEYKYIFSLTSKTGAVISSYTLDLPIEQMVVNIVPTEDGKLKFILKNGNEFTVETSAIIRGLATESYVNEKIAQEVANRNTAIATAQAELMGNINLKVNKADIINGLTSDETQKPLSAKQGKELKALLDSEVSTRQQAIEGLPFYIGTDGYVYQKD